MGDSRLTSTAASGELNGTLMLAVCVSGLALCSVLAVGVTVPYRTFHPTLRQP